MQYINFPFRHITLAYLQHKYCHSFVEIFYISHDLHTHLFNMVVLQLHFNVYFAEKYDCDEFMNNNWRFVLENFRFVAALDEFLNLEAKEVEKWLSRDDISVETEADVFKIVLEWIEHSKSERKALFEQLFRYVRLVLMSRDYLIDFVTNELLKESFACLMLTSAGLKMSSFSSEGGVL